MLVFGLFSLALYFNDDDEDGPALGSLHYENFIADAHVFPNEHWKTNAQLNVYLRNANPFALSYRAKISAEVNGKRLIDSEGNDVFQFKGFVPAGQQTILIYRIPDVPMDDRNARSDHPTLGGWARYDVEYCSASNSQKQRRTSRTLRFGIHASFEMEPPAGGRGTIQKHFDSPVMFSDEIEQ